MRFNKDGFIRLGMIILSSLIIVSCGDKSPAPTVKPKEDVKEVKESKETADKKDIAVANKDSFKKFNQYIEFYNDGLIGLSKELSDYLNKEGKTTTLKQSGKYTSGAKYKHWEEIKKYNKEKPDFKELDQTAAVLISAAEELDNLLASAREYYKTKAYTEDQYAKGQEFHTKIIAGSEKYQQAYTKFELALRAKENEYRSAEMEQAKKDGNDVVYNRILVSVLMDKILNELETQKVLARNVLTTDLTKIKPLYDELNQALRTLKEASRVQKLPKNKDLINDHYAKGFIETATKFKVGVVDLIDRVEKKRPLNAAELRVINVSPANGTPELLMELRKESIKDYNHST